MATAEETFPDDQNDEELELLRISDEINGKSAEELSEFEKTYYKMDRGEFGTVYKIPVSEDKFAVMKTISAEFSGKDIREYMETLKDVKHRNIVRHFGYRITEDAGNSSILLLFMEFVDGVTLREKIRNKELTVESALSYTEQLVDCLIYMKSKNMIHRDIKPENILIRNNDDCLKLMDFGLVKLIENTQNWSSLLSQSIRGTRGYMAPEVIQEFENSGRDPSCSVHYNYKVDVWSVGVVFTEMITGKSFPERRNNQEWSQYVRHIRMDLERTVAVYEQDVKLKCMEFFNKSVHESLSAREKPEPLKDILNVFPEIPLSFYPKSVTVIQDDLIGYDVQDNGQIVKCDNKQLDGPLVIVSEGSKSNKLQVYNVYRTNIGYVKLKDEMGVYHMIPYKEDMILSSDDETVKCVRMDGSLVCETTDSFRRIHGLCMVTDDVVAVCDYDGSKVVFLSVNNNLSVKSQVQIDKPLSACRLSDNEILVGCRDSNYYKITHFTTINELSGFDGLPWDMLSVTDDVMNTVYVLDYNNKTIHRLQINDNSITDCGVVVNYYYDGDSYTMSHFERNNKLYIVIADWMNKNLRLYKLNYFIETLHSV